jgi:bifunctional non-homologous end joining protein LigD
MRPGKKKEKRRRGKVIKAARALATSKPSPNEEIASVSLMPSRDHKQKFVAPMLATLVDEPFDKADWLFEVKWDGYRAIAEVNHGQVRLYSRNELSFAERYPTIVKELSTLKVQAILDGEIVAVNEQGVSNFQLMQNYLHEGKGSLIYYVFDLLELNGKDLRSEPLIERKKRLGKVVFGLERVLLSQYVETSGKAFFDVAQEHGLEGIMAKKEDSKYREGRRAQEWLKIKTHKRQEAVIAGYTDPQGSRARFGSLALGVYENGELTFIGLAGGGFNSATLEEVYQKLKPLEQKSSPFAHTPKTKTPVHWVKPNVICEVKFQAWTREGIMRQPVFLGLRTDKPPQSVRREMPEHAPITRKT